MIYTLDDIKRINREHGGYFFDPHTMRCFHSRVSERVYQGVGGVYFVTSERMDDKHPRLYSVRRFDPDTGGISSVQGKPKFKRLSDACYVADELAKGADKC